jgi:hypothetical protein
MDYVVAIPSYDRAELLLNKTLKTCQEQNIKPNKIDIFVANKEEESKYKSLIDKKLYNKMIVGVKGLSNQRNFITDYYPEGKYIVFMDDDIEAILKKKYNIKDSKELVKIDIDKFVKNAFKLLKEKKLFIWGVGAVLNPYFMYDKITTDLRYLVGAFFGVINRHSKDIKLSKDGDLEDILRTILYYKKDRGVLKFNNITIKTKYYNVGGLQSEYGDVEKRIKSRKERAEKLFEKYPEYISNLFQRPSGLWEVRLKRNPIIKGGSTYKKMLNIDLSDKDSNDIYYEPIDKTEKYLSMKEGLFNQLEKTSIGKIEGPRKDGKATRGSIIGYIGYTINFGCGGRRNLGVGEYRPNDRYPELFDRLVKFGNYILPKGYTYQVITVNKDVKAKRHMDKNNNGFTVATTLGNFTGGGLIVGKDGKDKTYNLKDHILAFNGALLEHQTEPFKGRRYTIIYYKQKKPCKIKNKTLKGEGKKNDIVAKLHISPNKQKKYRAIFYEDGEEIKSVDFGAKNMSDYTIHKDKERKERYIKRHQKNEDWENPYTAGALSRWVLWEKPTLKSSWDFYKKKFNFI